MIKLVQRRLWWGVFFLGIILLIYMFRVESEPGALPLFFGFRVAGWTLVKLQTMMEGKEPFALKWLIDGEFLYL